MKEEIAMTTQQISHVVSSHPPFDLMALKDAQPGYATLTETTRRDDA